MSIFHHIQCEICGVGISIPGRCTRCKQRYDQAGKPFIIFCDIIKLECARQSMFLWIMDGKVVNHNGYQPYIKGNPMKMTGWNIDDLLKVLTDEEWGHSFEITYQEEAVWK